MHVCGSEAACATFTVTNTLFYYTYNIFIINENNIYIYEKHILCFFILLPFICLSLDYTSKLQCLGTNHSPHSGVTGLRTARAETRLCVGIWNQHLVPQCKMYSIAAPIFGHYITLVTENIVHAKSRQIS